MANGAVVRMIKESGETRAIEAWINPHFLDPIIVRLEANDAMWRWSDDPDKDQSELWSKDFFSNQLADLLLAEMEKIFRWEEPSRGYVLVKDELKPALVA